MVDFEIKLMPDGGASALSTELTALLKTELQAALSSTLDDVGLDMREALARHLETDVYAASVYTPKVYERRMGNGGLMASAEKARIYNSGTYVAVEFKPDGLHKNPEWSSDIAPDDLIGRIERHNPEYNWLPKKKKLPNRPFWQNFVNEMVDEGELERSFVAAFKSHWDDKKDIVVDGELEREPADGTYGN